MLIPEITFRRGTYSLNADPYFNFQLNRVIQWDGGRLDTDILWLNTLALRDENGQ